MAGPDPAIRRPGPTLSRYVAREALGPIAIAVLGLTVVVLTRDLIGFTELVLNRGVGALEMGRITFFEAVQVATTVLPFAALIGALVALGRLGADHEIIALEAAGVSAARLAGPLGRLASVFALVTAGLSMFGAPAAQRGLEGALDRIARDQPWTQIRAGAVNRFGGWQLEAREVSARGDELNGILLWVPDIEETIFARSGRVGAVGDGSLQLELDEGILVLSPALGPRQFRFEHLVTVLPASDEPGPWKSSSDPFRGLSWAALTRAKIEGADDAARNAAAREWHRRLATPITTVLLGLLAAPLFLTRSHFSRAGGSVLGIGVTVATFALAQLGEGLAQAGVTGIAGGVWLPNAVLATLAALTFWHARREGVLRRSLAKVRGSALRALPGRRPTKTRRRALDRYVASRFLELVALAFGATLTAYLMVDVMERLDWFARYGATGEEVLRFYAARIPLLASRVVPMALMVGSALIASLLAAEGELNGMRACGIPAIRAMAPALAISVAVAPLFFLLRNEVVPRTNALADQLKQTEIKADYYEQLAESKKTAMWHHVGSQVIEAARFDLESGDAVDLTIYDLGADGLPVSRADARAARHVGGGIWRLLDPTRIELSREHIERVPARSYAELGNELSRELDPMHLSIGELADEIELVAADGYDTRALRVDYYVKMSEALACIVLPFAVLLFAVVGPPFAAPAHTLLVSGILVVAHVLTTGVATSLGYSGALAPAVAGWLPTVVFGVVVVLQAIRLWKQM
jgi:lipopolysaccharide export system permease protein